MPKHSISIEEITQSVEEDIEEEINLDPSDIPEFQVSNIVQRTFAHLIGKTIGGSRVPIKATGDGKLIAATTPGGITQYRVESGSANDSYTSGNTYEYSNPYTTIDLLIESNAALVSFQDEDGTWGNSIPLKSGTHSIDFSAYGVKVKNRTGGNTADYSITLYR